MARWIRSRPPERCHHAEVEVAEFLADLPDDWVIRWGFMYQDNHGTQRETNTPCMGAIPLSPQLCDTADIPFRA